VADFGALIGGIGQSGLIGRAVVGLDLDTKKYQTELKAAEAQTQAGTQSIGQKFGALSGLAKAAFLGVGVAAVAGIAIAIKAGSDLNEQINKSKVVFGQAAKGVMDFADTAASAFGIAKSEALEAAGNFGQLFQAAGFVDKAAASMSVKMVQLSADLGSFNNIPVAEALEKIRSGLAGEAEPLRQLGVFLSEAAVETEAYASGIAKQGEELTDAQKIQARYNIILDSTTKAQGDFGRTVGESLPNQLKVLKAELTNTAADLGTVLLPIVLEVVKAFKLVVPLLKFAADHLDLIVAALLGFAAVKYVPALLHGIELGLIGITKSAGTSLTAQGNITSFMGTATALAPPLIAGLVGIGYAIKQMGDIAAETDRQVAGLTTRLADGKIGVDAYKTAVVEAEAGSSMFAGRLPKVTQEAKEVAEAGLETAYAIGRMHMAEAEAAATADKMAHSHEVAGKAIKNFANMTTDELKTWRADTVKAFNGTILALEDLTTESGITSNDFIAATQRMKREAQDLARALREMSKEHWIPDAYVKFLSEQGPEWVIAFQNLNQTAQERAVQNWKATTEKTDQAKESLDKITGVLKDLDKSGTKHKVTIEYDYVGFDPSKPGMSAGQTGGATGQQR
jgi:hypothetical protein